MTEAWKHKIVVEWCPEISLYVGSIPGWPGAHSQGASIEELYENLREVIALILEDGRTST